MWSPVVSRVLLAGVLVAPLTVLTGAASGSESAVLVRGNITARGGGEVVATATLVPVATRANVRQLGRRSSADLDPGAVTVSGDHYEVRVDPSAVPVEFVSREGLVTLDLQFVNLDTGQYSTTTTSAVPVTTSTGARWADPLTPDLQPVPRGRTLVAGEADTVRGVPRLDVSMDQSRLSPRVLRTMSAPSARTTTAQRAVCGFPANAETTKRWATVGTSYPVRKDTSQLEYGNSSKSTFGVAVNTGSGWYGSGTKTIGDSWGTGFAKSSALRSYRIRVQYKRWNCYNSSGTTIISRKWMPVLETGGTWAYKLASRPNWTNCEPVAKSTWWRGSTRGSDYTLGYGVKFKDKIGVDLSTRRAYSSDSRLNYFLNARRRMCGNNNEPSVASKVRERLR